MANPSRASAAAQPIALAEESAERRLRIELAACYRLMARFGLDDLTYTHLSARVPGPEHHFLINPHGMLFHEVTASALVKIDFDGNVVEHTGWPVNRAGFVIHSAIHMARPDLVCVLHAHSEAGVAVSTLKCGLLPITQLALEFYDRVGYHDYEGIALDLDERERLVRDLGSKKVMILRSHGLLTCGATVAEAFHYMYYLEKACRVQLSAQHTREELILASPELAEHAARQHEKVGLPKGHRIWAALTRQLDREDPSYRD